MKDHFSLIKRLSIVLLVIAGLGISSDSLAADKPNIVLFLVDGQGREEAGNWVIPSFPHRELSSLSGLARETVTRVLRKLENKGLVSRDREVMRIPDLASLEALVG